MVSGKEAITEHPEEDTDEKIQLVLLVTDLSQKPEKSNDSSKHQVKYKVICIYVCVCMQFREVLQEANAVEKIKSLVDPALDTDYPVEAVWKVFG